MAEGARPRHYGVSSQTPPNATQRIPNISITLSGKKGKKKTTTLENHTLPILQGRKLRLGGVTP